MGRKRNNKHIIPNYPTEIDLWVAEQQLLVRLATIQFSLTPSEHVRPVQAQLSPISFLPSEILIHIFHLGLSQIPHSARAFPLSVAVAGVCRSWRAVALRTPKLWTRIFVTSATPFNLVHTYLMRSQNFEIDVDFCHWPVLKRVNEVNSSEAYLVSIVDELHHHTHRLRSLSLWDVSDSVVCIVMSAFVNFVDDTPRLVSVSVKANPTISTQYHQLDVPYALPFLSGKAPLLAHLDIRHFPIGTSRTSFHWPFDVRGLSSLTLRTQECSMLGPQLPAYLINFSAFCALLRSAPNLVTLALYGPVVEPDEEFLPGATLPSLETLVIHRRYPEIQYHSDLLRALAMPALKRLEIPWHDDLTVESPYMDYAATYFFDEEGRPRFSGVKTLCLHDSTVARMMPTRTFMRGFPNVEEVVLGGRDVANFAATLRGFVLPGDAPVNGTCPARTGYPIHQEQEPEGVLADGAWGMVKKIVLKDPDMMRWKGWVRGYCKWLAASGHSAGTVCVEIQNAVLREADERKKRAFGRGLARLAKYARVVVM